MKPFRFHLDAELEMIDAAAWYETQLPNLGRRFLTSVQDALNRIDLNPMLFPAVEGSIRRCLTKTFPFSVVFEDKNDFIAILAVMHQHRDPDYWKQRSIEDDRES